MAASSSSSLPKLVRLGTKIIGVGRNYTAKGAVGELPKEPSLFMKPTTSYISSGGTIEIPEPLDNLAYEVELAVVMGKKARHVPEKSALDYVGGYAVSLDMTSREIQNSCKAAGLSWILAKGQDTFTPISEVLPPSAIPDPHNLELWLKVDDVLQQKGSTSDMIFTIPFLISYISSFMTLLEGDVILTGTPPGAGPVKPGQTISAGITGLLDIQVDVQRHSKPLSV